MEKVAIVTQSVEDCDFVPERAAHIRVLLSQAKQQYPFSDSLSTQRPVNSTSLVLFPRVNLIGGISTYCQAEGKTENPPSPARLMPLGTGMILEVPWYDMYWF